MVLRAAAAASPPKRPLNISQRIGTFHCRSWPAALAAATPAWSPCGDSLPCSAGVCAARPLQPAICCLDPIVWNSVSTGVGSGERVRAAPTSCTDRVYSQALLCGPASPWASISTHWSHSCHVMSGQVIHTVTQVTVHLSFNSDMVGVFKKGVWLTFRKNNIWLILLLQNAVNDSNWNRSTTSWKRAAPQTVSVKKKTEITFRSKIWHQNYCNIIKKYISARKTYSWSHLGWYQISDKSEYLKTLSRIPQRNIKLNCIPSIGVFIFIIHFHTVQFLCELFQNCNMYTNIWCDFIEVIDLYCADWNTDNSA